MDVRDRVEEMTYLLYLMQMHRFNGNFVVRFYDGSVSRDTLRHVKHALRRAGIEPEVRYAATEA